jgi:c-di-GMP-binding flagellar brake protein YcgR
MLMTPERRHSERARIPCHIPVELTDAARAAQFEADAVDLSVGGLSLRAAQLPSVGSQLFCTFEAMPGGAQILGRGEVVWSQPTGDEGGEFGLRFIEVDARNQALIDEMVA